MIVKNKFLINLNNMNLEDFKKWVLTNYIFILGSDYYNDMDLAYQNKYKDIAGDLDKFITNLIIEGGF